MLLVKYKKNKKSSWEKLYSSITSLTFVPGER